MDTVIICDMSYDINITSLDLAHKNISVLPPEICQLTQLTRLDLQNNKLTCLPNEIGQLKQLKILNLADNYLTCLPPEIGQLTQLRILYLNNNNLTELPPEIGQLIHLTWLELLNNNLTCLVPEICQLTRLRVLTLSYNQIQYIPKKCIHWLSQYIIRKIPSICYILGNGSKYDFTYYINKCIYNTMRNNPILTNASGIFNDNKEQDRNAVELYLKTHKLAMFDYDYIHKSILEDIK